jgi:hypothetical protein
MESEWILGILAGVCEVSSVSRSVSSFSEGRKPEQRSKILFSGTGITPPLYDRILGYSAFRNLF